MTTENQASSAAAAYNVRIPSLFEIFFGKLANWIRQLAIWRKLGLLRKAMQARRQRSIRLETLEPRVLLSADLTYGALVDTGDHDYTLRATGGDTLAIVDTGTSAVIESITLDANDHDDRVEINIKRFSDVHGALNADTLRIDVESLELLDAFVTANGGLLQLNFDGGSELFEDDQVSLDLSDTPSLGFGLYVPATSWSAQATSPSARSRSTRKTRSTSPARPSTPAPAT
jgi:hypothetical protein